MVKEFNVRVRGACKTVKVWMRHTNAALVQCCIPAVQSASHYLDIALSLVYCRYGQALISLGAVLAESLGNPGHLASHVHRGADVECSSH